MKYSKTISAIMISGLIISACSSKKEAATAQDDAATVTEMAANPGKVLTAGKIQNIAEQSIILQQFFLLKR